MGTTGSDTTGRLFQCQLGGSEQTMELNDVENFAQLSKQCQKGFELHNSDISLTYFDEDVQEWLNFDSTFDGKQAALTVPDLPDGAIKVRVETRVAVPSTAGQKISFLASGISLFSGSVGLVHCALPHHRTVRHGRAPSISKPFLTSGPVAPARANLAALRRRRATEPQPDRLRRGGPAVDERLQSRPYLAPGSTAQLTSQKARSGSLRLSSKSPKAHKNGKQKGSTSSLMRVMDKRQRQMVPCHANCRWTPERA